MHKRIIAYSDEAFRAAFYYDYNRDRDWLTTEPEVAIAISREEGARRAEQRIRKARGLPPAVRLRWLDAASERVSLRKDETLEARHRCLARNAPRAISQMARSRPFGLSQGPMVGNKQTYEPERAVSTRMLMSAMAWHLRSGLRGQPSSRKSILNGFAEVFKRPTLMHLIKTDIKGFFESIDHNLLLQTITSNPRIDPATRKLVHRLLTEYRRVSGMRAGVPRGVNVSQILAELFLADIDDAVNFTPGVLFYGRYVDDIVIVCDSQVSLDRTHRKLQELAWSKRLRLNDQKTTIYSESKSEPGSLTAEYLGFRFHREVQTVSSSDARKRNSANKHFEFDIGMSASRFNRVSERLDTAFDAWIRDGKRPEQARTGSHGLLINRIKYLTGSTRLRGAKHKTVVGFQNANWLLSASSADIRTLDRLLQAHIDRNASSMPSWVRERLVGHSFRRGMQARPFYRYTWKEIHAIVSCW